MTFYVKEVYIMHCYTTERLKINLHSSLSYSTDTCKLPEIQKTPVTAAFSDIHFTASPCGEQNESTTC